MKQITQIFLKGDSPALRAIIWWKSKKDWTQALCSFLFKVLCNRMIYNATIPSLFYLVENWNILFDLE